MKKNILFIALLAIISFTACNKNVVYNETKDFDHLMWDRSEKLKFTIDVTDDTCLYDLAVNFRYAEGFVYTHLNVEMKTTDPHGQSVTTQHQFKIKNSDNSYIGDGSGDIWDYQSPIVNKIKLEKGTYTFEFTHLQPQDKMLMVMEFGLQLNKSVNQ